MTLADAIPAQLSTSTNTRSQTRRTRRSVASLHAGTGSRFGGAQANMEAFTDTQWLTVRVEIPSYPF
jgi:benzaldehyde dehydrogenase (NAD)